MELVTVDAFADAPFTGNPAAVCILDAPAPTAWMQSLAAEMNLPETAFVHATEASSYDLRWFTTTVEVDLCGHATLASAHVLWETGRLGQNEDAAFDTRSGRLTCQRRDGFIEMDFPADPPAPLELAPDAALEAVGRVGVPAAAKGRDFFLLELGSEAEVVELRPVLGPLRLLNAVGLIVTARSHRPGIDFVSRFFAPRAGINEDHVTGSAHCTLAPYWSAILGRAELTGYQASARGGTVHTRLAGDRVILGGSAVTVLRANLAIKPT